jgi:hypothetical protein
MSNPSPLFSTIEYFRNHHFNRCMRNWNKYVDYTGDASEEMMAEWEEILLKDFLNHAREWLNKNKNMVHWKSGLE